MTCDALGPNHVLGTPPGRIYCEITGGRLQGMQALVSNRPDGTHVDVFSPSYLQKDPSLAAYVHYAPLAPRQERAPAPLWLVVESDVPSRSRAGRRKLTALIAPLGVLGVAVASRAPRSRRRLLVRAPLALIALNPVYTHLILASNSIAPVPFFVVAVARLFAADPFYFLIGREYGGAAIEWVERRSALAGRVARFIERLFQRAGPVVLFVVPAGLVCVLAGASRMRARTFVAINLAGTLAVVLLVRAFGHAFADPIETVRNFVETNILVLTAVSALVVAVSALLRRKKARPHVDRADVIETHHDP